jgi:hypothetical protein
MITGDIILSFFKYTMLNQFLQRIQNKKLALNSTALIQATTSSFIWLYGSSTQLRINTSGYFLFDLLYLLTQREKNFLHSTYYYHHLVSIYYMSLDPINFNWFNIIGVGEVSNIPGYIVYYYLKTKPVTRQGVLTDSEIAVEKLEKQLYNSKLEFWKSVQKFWFSGIRVIVATYLTYNELIKPNHIKPLLPVIPLYFLGIVWSLNMHKNQ